MSKIIDKLKEAEAQRQRVVAERKRIEAEADAALAGSERDDAVVQARGADPLQSEQQREEAAAKARAAIDRKSVV